MALADFALVVGIDRYPGISPLSGAEADAREFWDWVTTTGGIAPGNARRIVSSESQAAGTVDDERPEKREIENFFVQLANIAKDNNRNGLGLKVGQRVYMFFSGHGFAPSLDRSGVLMANATDILLHNIGPRLWADRLYQNGLFEEVLLFQDACRSRIADADLTPPFLKLQLMPGEANRKRFYAFAAKNRQLATEKKDANGQVHGVFSATLMEGLRGAARDPRTGDITTAQLKGYLQDNMKNRLTPAELADDSIAKRPEIEDPDPFVIAPGVRISGGAQPSAAVPNFPVRIRLPQANLDVHVEDNAFVSVAERKQAPPVWELRLPRGFYKAVIRGADRMFQVSGAIGASGKVETVDVALV